jgi:hypothetical protein
LSLVLIPPRRNRKEQGSVICIKHVIWWRTRFVIEVMAGIAPRYVKRARSYLAAVQIRCIFCWLKIS